MQYRFGNCLLDSERCALSRGGEPVQVRRKVLLVLLHLAANANRVVSKQELFEEIWRGRIVGDATLNSCIKEARRAVGDNGAIQAIVRTVHGLGYQLVAELAFGDPGPPDSGEPEGHEAADLRLVDREYKQVTVLACDLLIQPRASSLTEDEATDGRVRRFLEDAAHTIEAFTGRVTERLEAGLTAIFGAPEALEDHARRALLAATEIRRSGAAFDPAILRVRIGLHAGRVLVDTAAHGKNVRTAVGNTTRVARNIRDLADDTILVSADVKALLEREVQVTRMPHALQGMPELFRLDRHSERHGDWLGKPGAHRSPFVGRQDDMQILQRRTEAALAGAGQAVFLSGEPGIGKTRLIAEVLQRIERDSARVFVASCQQHRTRAPYYPVLQLLRQTIGTDKQHSRDEMADSIVKKAGDAGIGDPKAHRLLAHLLEAHEDRSAKPSETPRVSLEQGIALSSQLVLHECTAGPLVIVVEDLHWVDSTTEQWLSYFVHRIVSKPVLLLASYRPGYTADWLGHSNTTQLSIPRLNDEDSGQIVTHKLAEDEGSTALCRQIVSVAQGNPFFLEELSKSASGLLDGDSEEIPATVQSVLSARIDQLRPAEKALLQLASVVGISISGRMLEAVWPGERDTLDEGIDRLHKLEFLISDRTSDDVKFYFRHALTQEVAYRSIPSEDRREWHEKVATTYESGALGSVADNFDVLGHHFSRAESYEKAFEYWEGAGHRATRQSACKEAVGHFREALAAIDKMPRAEALERKRLSILLQLGPAQMAVEGIATGGIEKTYLAAERLSESCGSERQHFAAMWGLWNHYSHSGATDRSMELSRRLLALAQSLADDAYLLQAHHACWTVHIWHGDIDTCLQHAERGIDIYDKTLHAEHRYSFAGHDPGCCALATASIATWFQGNTKRASALMEDSAALAAELDHQYSIAIAHTDLMVDAWLNGDADATLRHAEAGIQLCEDLNYAGYLAVAKIFHGWAVARRGQMSTGLAELREGLDAFRRTGAKRNLCWYLLPYVDVLFLEKKTDQALQALGEAESAIATTGEIRWIPEILRWKACISMARGRLQEAEAVFRESLEVASTHGAHILELRSSTGLAQLLMRMERNNEARSTLDRAVRRVPESQGNNDVDTANRLIEKLQN